MAYVPPHKRQSLNSASRQPTPVRPPSFQKPQQDVKMYRPDNIAYAEGSVKKWFAVGVSDQSLLSAFTRLDPVPVESFGRTSLALVLKENGEEVTEFDEEPWQFVAETVKQDFVSSLQRVKDSIKEFAGGVVKPNLIKDVMQGFKVCGLRPYLVVRLGKVLFHGNHELSLESIKRSSLPGDTLKELRKSFHTSLQTSYMQWVSIGDVVNKIGLELHCDKDTYHVLLNDKTKPCSAIVCKCIVDKDTNELQLYKILICPLRNLVEDMSCLDKNLDVRLMLLTKRILYPVGDDELANIKRLISNAKLDSEIKGGLQWPFGSRSVGRFSVFKVWHKTSKTFTNSTMKLTVRQVNRYDFEQAEGETAQEIYVKLPGIESQLVDDTFDPDIAFGMLKEKLELIWKHFLCEQS